MHAPVLQDVRLLIGSPDDNASMQWPFVNKTGSRHNDIIQSLSTGHRDGLSTRSAWKYALAAEPVSSIAALTAISSNTGPTPTNRPKQDDPINASSLCWVDG